VSGGSPPIATYRVQLHQGFGFDDAAAIAPYLADLGISHLYCSPYLQARSGSMHGYDVVDHRSFNTELGGPSANERMHKALEDNGLGQILDIVPNHMAVNDERNRWWWDVLENGRSSRYASYFDIDWESPQEPALHNKVLLPILGDHYGRILERGELQLQHDEDGVRLHYYDNVFPLSRASLAFLPQDRAAWDDLLAEMNKDLDRLHEVLEQQHYRLSNWRAAAHELDYRRFFDVNDLAALRIEDPQVFDDVHWLILRLVESGRVHGLRVDHIDGLRDPRGYLEELRSASGVGYLVVEKILEPGETLPQEWPVEGTTGYDFLNRVGALFVDLSSEGAFDELYSRFTGMNVDLERMTLDKKRLVLDQLLASDVERLVVLFSKVCERHLRFRDFTRFELREALRSTMGSFHVYRTYVDPDTGEAAAEDLARIAEATEAAKARRDDLDPELFDFLRTVLSGRFVRDPERELFARFQQATGPVMAKAVEDTVFYNFNRMIALNEVGGNPGRFGMNLDDFHRETSNSLPLSMLATSTHDTKRSEDVRARISLLSEIPERWDAAIHRWAAINERYRSADMPDRNMEYLLYQTLVGAWPLSADRAVAYMEKASKEAKSMTSWIDPDPRYDEALRAFIEGALSDETFLGEVETFVRPLVGAGRINSLAQLLIKLTAPGVPDIYQGNEVWDLSLVDPDNRRPVDHVARRSLLERLQSADAQGALALMEQGGPKMWLLHRALRLRRSRPDAFAAGAAYTPLRADGDRSNHVIAYGRGRDVVAVAPRLILGLGEGWGRTSLQLPDGRWRDVLRDEELSGRIEVAELLGTFPVALLERV
jgi:(1->4)-alpha-D-glucan 1-alpha-D-glucosylmutase